jgi:hypothetical protein
MAELLAGKSWRLSWLQISNRRHRKYLILDNSQLFCNQVGLAVPDLFFHELSGPLHNEQYIVVEIQFRTLVRQVCVLDQQIMKVEVRFDDAEQPLVWLMHPKPDDATLLAGERANFLDSRFAHTLTSR